MQRFVIIISLLASTLGAVPSNRRPHSDGRIIGGTAADIHDFPYQVSLEINGWQNCGGSIISEDWVLTAAHCVYNGLVSSMSFRAGSAIMESGGTVHPASQIIFNENFNRSTLDYDVAVVKVSVPFEYSDTVQPITLTSEEPPTGSSVVVSGWGLQSKAEDELQKVEINITDFDECNATYIPEFWELTSRMICAGVPHGGKGVCYGDSGGPLVHNGKIVGIVSWGHDCALTDYPQVYTNVANLRSWITSQTGVN